MPSLTVAARLSIGVLTLAVVACAPSAIPTTAPAITAANPTPAVTPALTPSATANPGPVAIGDGTYETDPIQVADMRAAIEGDDRLTDPEKTDIIDNALALGDHQTIVIQIVLAGGKWAEAKSYDGGAFKVGSRATYAFPDSTTVVINEQCCGLTTFAVTPVGAGFKLEPVAGQRTELDIVTSELIFGSAPFQPAQ